MALLPTKPKKQSAPKEEVIRARCGKKAKRRVLNAKKSTGLDEADFVRVALEEFFARHRTPAEQIAAVKASRAAQDAMTTALAA